MRDSRQRSIVKAVTWQALGLVVTTAITWGVTGSVATGGMIAVLGAATGSVTYLLHERLWAHIAWGCAPDTAGKAPRRVMSHPLQAPRG